MADSVPGDPDRIYPIGSMQTPLTFFLFGFYGQGNLGDDLLLRATIDGICRIAPVRRFVIRNEGDAAGLSGLSVPIELTGIDRIAADQTRSKFRRLASTLLAYRQYLKQCDWFVFGGGTLFHERSSVVPLAMTFLVCLLARLLGVRIAALGVGVAEMRSATGRMLLRCIVLLSDIFAVRDELALTECVKAGAKSRVVLTADLVFAMTSDLHGRKSSTAGTPTVGVSVYVPALLNRDDGDRVSAAMRDAIQMLLIRGWRVVLLGFLHRSDTSSVPQDRIALTRLADSLPEQYQEQIALRVLEADNINGIAQEFSTLTVHCGMRFHGHVLSAIFEKPFVGIAVDNKIDAICRMFGMPVMQLSELSSERLVQAIDRAITSRIDPKVLAECEKNAERNFSQLATSLSAFQPALR